MNLAAQEMNLLAGPVLLFVILALFLHYYKIRLLSHSLRLCNWICGMAISSDSPWVKMLVLHLVFFVRLLMYLAIVSLERMDKLTTRSMFRHYISGSRVVLLEFMFAFTNSSKSVEEHIYSQNYQTVRKKQLIRK